MSLLALFEIWVPMVLLSRFLVGDTPGAKVAFEDSIKALPSFTNSHVKLASVHMDLGDPVAALKQYDLAIAQNPKDADIYYQRGQGMCMIAL